MRNSIRVAVAVLGVLTSASTAAHANGRFPGAFQLVTRGDRIAVNTSFGLLMAPKSFTPITWACEDALGYSPQLNNELGIALFPNGGMVVSGPFGLTTSADHGCNNPKTLASVWMSDVSVDENSPTTGIAVARGPNGAECKGQVYETKDQGATWTPLGSPLEPGFCAFTIDSAPSDKKRIYVSGNVEGTDNRLIGRLLVSDDRGLTWTDHDVPNQPRPFIGAMHPTEKDTVYVRTVTGNDSGDVLVTRDGGKTFKNLATLHGVPLQFYGATGLAVSPDGNKLAYGSLSEGLFVVEGKDGTPEKRGDLKVMCLAWNEDGLYACSAPNLCGSFFLGKSADDGRNFDVILPTLDIGGDKSTCAAGTASANLCPSQWAGFRARMRACGDEGGIPPVDSGSTADAGSNAAPPALDCSCRALGLRASHPFAVGLVALGATLGLVRRASQRRRRKP